MNRDLERRVAGRAGRRCEYCQIPDQALVTPFQIDHVLARKHGGTDDPSNLAYCCLHCNRHKGPNIAGIDPKTGKTVRLFHPRKDLWHRHFRWKGAFLEGLTAVGRTTVETLRVNAPLVLELREALREELGR